MNQKWTLILALAAGFIGSALLRLANTMGSDTSSYYPEGTLSPIRSVWRPNPFKKMTQAQIDAMKALQRVFA